MLPVRISRAKAIPAFHLAIHQQVPSLDRQLRADAEAVALHAKQVDFQPVIPVPLEIPVERIVGVIPRVMAA